jgi:quercetin dioxygenase-like cupin family protein
MKLVRGATSLPLTPIDVPGGKADALEDNNWRQTTIFGPQETNGVADVAIGEHTTSDLYDIDVWYRQFAFVLGGEMVVQNRVTGDVYRGHKGDAFYWAPGLKARVGGQFRVYTFRTPPPVRFVQTPKGKQSIAMKGLENEITAPSAPPTTVRSEVVRRGHFPVHNPIKFVRGLSSMKAVKVADPVRTGFQQVKDWQNISPVDPTDTVQTFNVSLVDHPVHDSVDCDHRWDQFVFCLDGEMETIDVDTGDVFHLRPGDVLHWRPGLHHTIAGIFRVIAIRCPEIKRYEMTDKGKREINLLTMEQIHYPGTPPDAEKQPPLTSV